MDSIVCVNNSTWIRSEHKKNIKHGCFFCLHNRTGSKKLCQKFRHRKLWRTYIMNRIPKEINLLSQSYYDLLLRYKTEHRCLKCRRVSYEKNATCESCVDHQYCSLQCLHAHSEKHRSVCLYLGLRRRRFSLHYYTSSTAVYEILSWAKVLDDFGNIDCVNTHCCSLWDLKAMFKFQRSSEDASKTEALTNKMKDITHVHCDHQNEVRMDSSYNERKTVHQRSNVEVMVAGGMFASNTSLNTGNTFGDGWWRKHGKNGFRISPEACGFMDTLKTKTRLKFVDFYGTDSDEEDTKEAGAYASMKCSFDTDQKSSSTSQSERKSKIRIDADSNMNPEQSSDLDINNTLSSMNPEQTSDFDIKEKDISSSCSNSIGQDTPSVSSSNNEECLSATVTQTSDLNTCNSIVPLKATSSRDQNKTTAAKKDTSFGYCQFCRSCSNNIKTCARCGHAKYCSKTCQVNHYPHHKEFCNWMKEALIVKSRIPSLVTDMLQMKYGTAEIEFDWYGVPDLWPPSYHHEHVLAKIVMTIPLPNGCYFMTLENSTGDQVNLFIRHALATTMFHVPNFGEPISLFECMAPGNFVLMMDVKWSSGFPFMGLVCSDEQCFFILNAPIPSVNKNVHKHCYK